MDERQPLPPGTMIDSIRVDDIVTSGGFGLTYWGEDTRLERIVFVKEYFPLGAAKRGIGRQIEARPEGMPVFKWGRQRCLEEARILGRLTHHGFPRVMSFQEANGTAYTILAAVEGGTLEAALGAQPAPLPDDDVRALLSQILDAVELLHAEGIVHRDLAPDNIMLTIAGDPVLTDLFCAHRIGHPMNPDWPIAKPGYSPIEQYSYDFSRLGPWSDIYAIGALFYRITTGIPPVPSIQRVDPHRADGAVDQLIPLARAALARYSTGLTMTIEHALAIEPQDRPASIQELRRIAGI